MESPDLRLVAALAAGDASTRLTAVLFIGSNPQPRLLDALVQRCAIEPDFYVRCSPAVEAHARATERLLRGPDAGSGAAVGEAKRIFVLGNEGRKG